MLIVSRYIQYDLIKLLVNTPNGAYMFGLGDWIRGILTLFDICKKHKVRLKATFQEHPIRDYLEYEICEEPIEMVFLGERDGGITFNNLLACNYVKDDVINMCVNFTPINNISDEAKAFVKSLFKPKLFLELKIQEILSRFNLEQGKYNVIHIRTGDKIYEGKPQTDIYETIKDSIKRMNTTHNFLNTPTIVLSDDKDAAKYIANAFGFVSRSTDSCHLGLVTFGDYRIMDTLIDFFLISRSAKIIHLSTYWWISGFCKWIAKCYDIPIITCRATNSSNESNVAALI